MAASLIIDDVYGGIAEKPTQFDMEFADSSQDQKTTHGYDGPLPNDVAKCRLRYLLTQFIHASTSLRELFDRQGWESSQVLMCHDAVGICDRKLEELVGEEISVRIAE